MSAVVVGREEELASLRAFLGGPAEGLSSLVLEGEAGVGKSTLWSAGVESARVFGFRVLRSRPAEADRGLAHAGLGDLLEGALDEVLPALAAPRRRALEVALLLEEEAGGAVDPRAIGIGTRGALELLAADGPVLIAIDDVQWLDASSAAALAFALRRLGESCVRVLLALRHADGAPLVELERTLALGRVERVTVGPLSVGALHRLLRNRLGGSFARQTLLRIHESSGGNPFFALELARVLGAEVDPPRPLPVPETLDALVLARLSQLPEPTRDALALTAALGAPPESLLERAGVTNDALVPAFQEQIVERDAGTVRFTHPLLSAIL